MITSMFLYKALRKLGFSYDLLVTYYINIGFSSTNTCNVAFKI